MVAGEAAAVFVLEAEDSASARGVEPYAELVSCAAAGPTEGGCAESMRLAMLPTGERSPHIVVAHGEGACGPTVSKPRRWTSSLPVA